jgi:hypothetical protein
VLLPTAGLVLVLLAQPQPSVEPPVWRIPNEKRVERRFDPAKRQARVDAARKANLKAEGPAQLRSSSGHDAIVGRDYPDLLLPFEVFRRLVRVGFSDDPGVRDGFRASVEPARRELGLPDEFWAKLEGITVRYRLSAQALQQTPSASSDEKLSAKQSARGVCSARAKALAAARREFGEETFNRFLYLGVAPGMVLISDDNAPGPEKLLEIEKGCD